MTKFQNYVRSFGMSGLLIGEEFRAIEQKLGVDLGYAPPSPDLSPVDYYPQFEQSVRNEAREMAQHYELFYCLEKSIRNLISETLQESDGAGWWEGGRIPKQITDDVNSNIQRELDSGVTRRSDAAIDYTTFGQLSVIITSNWNIFGTIFNSRRAVERVMSNLNTLRGPIAHCCPLADDEIVRLKLAVKDWFRIIG